MLGYVPVLTAFTAALLPVAQVPGLAAENAQAAIEALAGRFTVTTPASPGTLVGSVNLGLFPGDPNALSRPLADLGYGPADAIFITQTIAGVSSNVVFEVTGTSTVGDMIASLNAQSAHLDVDLTNGGLLRLTQRGNTPPGTTHQFYDFDGINYEPSAGAPRLGMSGTPFQGTGGEVFVSSDHVLVGTQTLTEVIAELRAAIGP